MKVHLLAVCALVALPFAGRARAHEIPTHLNITRVAVDFLVAVDDRFAC